MLPLMWPYNAHSVEVGPQKPRKSASEKLHGLIPCLTVLSQPVTDSGTLIAALKKASGLNDGNIQQRCASGLLQPEMCLRPGLVETKSVIRDIRQCSATNPSRIQD